jgi:hypothetical protein
MENHNENKPLFGGHQVPLPNYMGVFMIGVCSVVLACAGVGLILGIIGVVMAGPGRKLYQAAPEMYEGYGLLNAGYILSIIGIVIGAIGVVYLIALLVFGVLMNL